MNVETGKILLLYAYIVPFFSWMFDVLTTFYAIDCLGIAGEMNPLGWPLGALGALIFYVPAYIFTYMPLFRLQGRCSPWVAVLITMLALGLGVMNLLAGLHNLEVVKIRPEGTLDTTRHLIYFFAKSFSPYKGMT